MHLLLTQHQSPGDIVMMTGAVRDVWHATAGRIPISVRTTCADLWQGNPYLSELNQHSEDVREIACHYPTIHKCNQSPHHFVGAFQHHIGRELGIEIKVNRISGDLHLSDEERTPPPDLPSGYWIVIAGGKTDYTCKWPNPFHLQDVVDHYAGVIPFVQCGENGSTHFHPELSGVIDMIGQTTIRGFLRLVYHSAGVVCPVTFAMHVAACFDKPCIVLAGGREPSTWEGYPTQRYLSTVGCLPCCRTGACWRSRCQRIGDGDAKDRDNLCQMPVQVCADLAIPKCLDMITAADIIREIDRYRIGG